MRRTTSTTTKEKEIPIIRKLFAPALVFALVATGAAGLRASDAPAKDIVDTAVAAGSFTTLAKALEAAGLVETLKGQGPFTHPSQVTGERLRSPCPRRERTAAGR